MEIDLHGLELVEAKFEVYQTLRMCKIDEDNVLKIIHGYQRGRVLQNYFRSRKFLQEFLKDGYRLKRIKSPRNGITIFQIL